ncbi:MAG: tetraacyldisaccharide 4'-kinase, partial [Candidatus Fermentibacter daniensis]
MKRPDLVFRSIAERRGGWRFAGMALSPAGAVFGLAANLRRRAYSLGLGRKLRACVPVVSVGNIEVGGIGKTPVTVWLARRLVSAGFEIAVAARDLNRRSGPPLNASLGAWSSDSPPSDEVLMLAKQLPGCSVFAGPSKAQAAVRAAAEVSPDLLLVDEGFQHLT